MTLRAGIVGCGGISRAHATAYANLDGVTLSALCDINADALNARADEHGVSARYSDYEEMFEKEELDVVSACTHAPLHGPVAIAAAKHGVNVLSEKPLSIDLQTADKMVAACKEAGVRLAVSHQFRFTPLFQEAKAWIDAGRIGEFRSIREVGKGRPAGFELMEMGVHYFDGMDLFLDGIEWIHAQVTYDGHEVGVEDIMTSRELCKTDKRDNGIVAGDTMLIHVKGKNGASGVMELYRRQQVQGWMMGPHILGSEGQLMNQAESGTPLSTNCGTVLLMSPFPPIRRSGKKCRLTRNGSESETVYGKTPVDLERSRHGQLDQRKSPASTRRRRRLNLARMCLRRLRVPLHGRSGNLAAE